MVTLWAKEWSAVRLLVAAASCVPLSAFAQDQAKPLIPTLKVSGYGDLQASYLTYGPNRNLLHGAQKDSRVVFDTTRFALEIEGNYAPYDVDFVAEVEFEHGGTGAAMELEYDESGDYTTEATKGGEVQLEEFYVKKSFADHYSVKAGRIPVAIGLLSQYSVPTDYLGVRRSETETTMLPGKWTEVGVGFTATFSAVKAQLQAVNGLDSTGFSSLYWTARGAQGRFETVSATGMAGVARADLTLVPGLVFGVSAYHGNTSANRPQADLVRTCNRSDSETVAPCGYLNAPVTIIDAHAAVQAHHVRASAAYIKGHLKNADLISERNSRLANNLHVLRSPVATEAVGTWGELGVDLASSLGLTSEHRLEPFVRYEFYDTMAKVTGSVVKSPRAQRRVASVGLAYAASRALYAKVDFSQRTYGSQTLRKEQAVDVGIGFIY